MSTTVTKTEPQDYSELLLRSLEILAAEKRCLPFVKPAGVDLTTT